MPQLDAVALDLDGTLLEGDGRILEETLAVLRAADAAGIRVLLSTGRPPEDIARLGLRTGLAALGLPHGAVGNERDLLLRRGTEWVEVQPRNGVRRRQEIALTGALLPAVLGLEDELVALDPAYGLWDEAHTAARGFMELHFGSAERAALGARIVRARLLDGHPARPQIMANRTIFAIRHPDAGKGPNLAELCGLLGLQPRRVLAIGDAENDRSMLDGSWGFLPGAPGNAEPAIAEAVRAAGGTVAAAPRGAGVAELLARYLN